MTTTTGFRKDSKNCFSPPTLHEGDDISETLHGGSMHGSDKDLVGSGGGLNDIMVKHEYEVHVEDRLESGQSNSQYPY